MTNIEKKGQAGAAEFQSTEVPTAYNAGTVLLAVADAAVGTVLAVVPAAVVLMERAHTLTWEALASAVLLTLVLVGVQWGGHRHFEKHGSKTIPLYVAQPLSMLFGTIALLNI